MTSTLWREIARKRNAYLFIAPFYIIFIVFMVYPIGYSLWLSFYNYNGIMAPQFVGWRNYLHALQDEGFRRALANTAVFTVLTVICSSVIAIFLALFLNQVRFLRQFYRGLFFVPAIVSLVVVSLVWKLMLNSEVGLVNETVRVVGRWIGSLLGSTPAWAQHKYHFLDHPNPWVPLLTVTFVNIWGVVGYNTVIYLAGLQSIPAHLYEAARMDGASPIQQFFRVTLPLLRPTMFFVFLTTTIDSLQVFVLPSLMTPNSEATMSIVYYLFRNAFEFYRMGYASAIAYILFALTVTLSLALRGTLGRNTRWDPEE
jgi:ABC-type sugar transport system permease subunit